MANIKTAISLPEELFARMECLAQERKTSRSRLYSLALESYLRRREDQRLLEEINTLIVCPLSSNMRLANVGGNVLLELSEGGLSRQSVVVVSRVIAIDRSRLDEYVGILSMSRVRQIIAGIRLVTEPRDVLIDDEGERARYRP